MHTQTHTHTARYPVRNPCPAKHPPCSIFMPFRMQLSFNLNGFSPGPDIWQHSQSPLECAPTRQRVRQRGWEGARGCVCGRGMASSWLSTGDGDSCSSRGLIVLVDILSNNANKYTITHSSESEGGKRERGNGEWRCGAGLLGTYRDPLPWSSGRRTLSLFKGFSFV